jgi:hypothetical protein
MSKTVFFLNMFSDYQPPEPLLGLLSQAAITAADIDPEKKPRKENRVFWVE